MKTFLFFSLFLLGTLAPLRAMQELVLQETYNPPVSVDITFYHTYEDLRSAMNDADIESLSLFLNTCDVNTRFARGFTLLHAAASKGLYDMVEFLIDRGAEVNLGNDDGITPLHSVASLGTSMVAQLLLESGAHVDVRTKNGLTPLHTSAKKNKRGVARVLIENDADVNARNNRGLSPLHSAAYVGNTDLVALFLDHGASIDAQDDEKWTPLHSAARHGKKAVFALLLERGASRDIQTIQGVTLFGIAFKWCHFDYMKLPVSRRKQQSGVIAMTEKS